MNEKQGNMKNSRGDIERMVFEAMQSAGWLLPQTPQDVLRAEKELAESPVDLPGGLVDPYAVLDRSSRPIRIGGKLSAPRDSGIEQNLARAAREGGEIPPEVQKQMQKDRKKAEGKADE